jgi:hypothetical protein
MSSSALENKVRESLLNLNREQTLKDLFWSKLNYDRVNQELSCRNWNDRIAWGLTDNPLLLASGGTNNDFRVIYSRLKGDRLFKQKEREIVNKLLPDNPLTQKCWVKYLRNWLRDDMKAVVTILLSR